MPSGRVRWFDANKGYGFITNEAGADVFLPAVALPDGVTTLRKGAKVEYSVVDGRKGPQAMGVRLIESAPSMVKATRPKPDDMAAIVEDLIKLLDAATTTLRRPTARSWPRCCARWPTTLTYRTEIYARNDTGSRIDRTGGRP